MRIETIYKTERDEAGQIVAETAVIEFEWISERELAGRLLIAAGMNGIESQLANEERYPYCHRLEFTSAETLESAVKIIYEGSNR